MGTLLQVRGLRTVFDTYEGTVRAVDGVDLDVGAGEAVGLVGESGSGKSVTALSILRLLPEPPARIAAGEVRYAGEDLLRAPPRRLRAIRGGAIGMIFQEPMTSLNPVFQVGEQIAESVRLHRRLLDVTLSDRWLARAGMGTPRWRAREAAVQATVRDALREVGIADPERVARMYPHELSGGMRQRAMIAMAMACHPDLLIADEPTTALDVTIQAQILELMRDLQARRGAAVLLITHHLGVVAEFCARVAVMYAGRIVEEAGTEELFRNPLHPYTRGLLAAIPDPGKPGKGDLAAIGGTVPDLRAPPPGCHFHPRCPARMPVCESRDPKLVDVGGGHKVACFLHHQEALQ